jgi:hypothetical protein
MKRELNLSERTILQMEKMNKIMGGGNDTDSDVDLTTNPSSICTISNPQDATCLPKPKLIC